MPIALKIQSDAVEKYREGLRPNEKEGYKRKMDIISDMDPQCRKLITWLERAARDNVHRLCKLFIIYKKIIHRSGTLQRPFFLQKDENENCYFCFLLHCHKNENKLYSDWLIFHRFIIIPVTKQKNVGCDAKISAAFLVVGLANAL